MKTIATTKIQCPASSKRHDVRLFADGSCSCSCPDGVERAEVFGGRIALGATTSDGVRGCGALIALVGAAPTILRTSHDLDPAYGAWRDLYFAYRSNPVMIAALKRAEAAETERVEIRGLLMNLVEKLYAPNIGKRRFRETFRDVWDHRKDLERFVVAAFEDDSWTVPYMPDWKTKVFDQGLAVVDNRLVVEISDDDRRLVHAIENSINGGYQIYRFERVGRNLRRLSES